MERLRPSHRPLKRKPIAISQLLLSLHSNTRNVLYGYELHWIIGYRAFYHRRWHKRKGAVGSSKTFRRLLQRNGPTPLDEAEAGEYDWCGRGTPAHSSPGEKIPLGVCDSAGHGSTSSVDIVRRRRIKLARKLTYLTPRMNEKFLMKEVQALQKLRHATLFN